MQAQAGDVWDGWQGALIDTWHGQDAQVTDASLGTLSVGSLSHVQM